MNEKIENYITKHREILSFRELANGTVKNYCSYLKQYLSWASDTFNDKDISDISWEEIRSYLRYLKEIKGLNPRTVNVHIAQLRSFYRYVLYKDWDCFQAPSMRFDEPLPNIPCLEEVRTIIDSYQNLKHKAEIALLYSSGIRVSELCSLRCGDVQKSNERIQLNRCKNRSARYAVLSSNAYEILVAYIRKFYPRATKEDWLFPGQNPHKPISAQTIYQVFKNQLSSLGWQDRDYNLHSLHSAFGLHLYESGVDIMTIKEAMGHKSLASTARYLTLGIGNGRSVTSPYDFAKPISE
jgi:site-specific recombinase XerD